MNVVGSASSLEAVQQSPSAMTSAAKPVRASPTVTESSGFPFLAILKWLTPDGDAPDVDVAEKEKDKLSKKSDTTAVVQLPSIPIPVKPPILLSIPDFIQPQRDTRASEARSGAQPVQASTVEPELDTAAASVKSLLAFALMLAQRTPDSENTGVTIKDSALPQATAGAMPTQKQEISPDPVKTLGTAEPGRSLASGQPAKAEPAGPEPVREVLDAAAARQEHGTKDPTPEKQSETPHVTDQHLLPQTGVEVANVKADSTQAPAAPAPRSEAPRPELKTETNVTVRTPPAREISLKIAGADSGSVDLRISERAGRVHVDVRTPDGDLARSLRSDLGDLVGRLENKGFKAESWTPGAEATGVKTEHAEAGSEQDSGQAQNGGGQQHQQEHHQGRPRQHASPDWVEQWKTGMAFEQGIEEIYDNIGN